MIFSIFRILIFELSLIVFLFFTAQVFAVSLSITNVPSAIDQAQVFGVDVSLSCSGCNDSYLRGVFYPSGISYFGYTQDNSGNWSNAAGGNCTTFFKIAQSDLQTGTWSGTLKVKLDIDNSYYNGPGEYLFKVGRYTSSCSSPIWSSETTIAITGPTPTTTPVPTATSAPTATKTPTAVPATNTPIPTPTKIPSSTPQITSSLTSFPSSIPSSVLGVSKSADVKSSIAPTPEVMVAASSSENLPKIIIGIGVALLLSACGILAFRAFRKGEGLDP